MIHSSLKNFGQTFSGGYDNCDTDTKGSVVIQRGSSSDVDDEVLGA